MMYIQVMHIFVYLYICIYMFIFIYISVYVYMFMYREILCVCVDLRIFKSMFSYICNIFHTYNDLSIDKCM
jgi:hypothetical protein